MTTVAVIQARMGSTRLPGKVLLPLGGATVLGQVIRRVRACPGLDAVVVATTGRAADDPVAAEAARHGAGVFRGSEDDVLARYHEAARAAGAQTVVRVTADCPLFDPAVLAAMLVRWRRAQPLDYLSNSLERTYPRGLDAEVFGFAALERAHREARRPWEREHVTPYLYGHPERFRLAQCRGGRDLSAHRWTLDTPEDWELIRRIYDALGADGALFSTDAVLALLAAHPDWPALNAHVEQKTLPA